MENLVNNHLIYKQIFDNLEEEDLYKLWNINFFRESVQDYLMISKKIVWELFVENFNLNPDFIEIFSEKLITKCCVCDVKFNLKECRKIKEYQYCTFTSGSEIKFAQICNICDQYCKISKQDCEKCEGKKISGIMINKEEDAYYEDLYKITMHFVCCEPTHKKLCVCEQEYSEETQLFCLSHRMKKFTTNCHCEIICYECYESLDDECIDDWIF